MKTSKRKSTYNQTGFRSLSTTSVLALVVLVAIVIAAALLFAKGSPATQTTSTQQTTIQTTSTTKPPSSTTSQQTTSMQQTTTQQATSGKTLRVGIGVDADTLDPAGQTTTAISNIIRLIAEPLFITSPNGTIVPVLADSYNVSSNGTVYTIKLKKGIKFQDGEPLNSEAVKFTLERILDPNVKVPNRGNFLLIDHVEAVDEYTVNIYLKKPFAPFLGVLTSAYIIAPNATKQLGDKIANNPAGIGTGPYMFKEWVKGDHITLVANPNYWNGTPYFSQMIFKVVPDASTREAMLLSGDLDLIIQPPPSDLASLSSRGDVKVSWTISTREMYIGINTQYGPLNDTRVRQALNYAIDKDSLIKYVLFGLGSPEDSILPPFVLGHIAVGPYQYDPQKAKQLLAQAGYPNGFSVTLITPNGRYLFDTQVAETIAQYLRDIGIQVNVRTYDWPTYVSTILAPLNKTELQLFLLGWSPSVPDPYFYTFQLFHSSQFTPNGFNNFFYNNTEADKLLELGATTTDPQLRAQIYQNLTKIVWNDAPMIFLYYQGFVVAYRSTLSNVVLFPYEMVDFASIRMG
ncbi:MAG: ABC transporter substrate-binding protein [Desulfurococcales archaeon]|nr:ABC transporter substrate-binding protein [Desulfurococcales archaeon]